MEECSGKLNLNITKMGYLGLEDDTGTNQIERKDLNKVQSLY